MDAAMRNEEGFTIIELIILIAILGIMTAIAIPNIVGRMPTIRVNSAARDLASGMRLARAKAVSESNRYVIPLIQRITNIRFMMIMTAMVTSMKPGVRQPMEMSLQEGHLAFQQG